jgi:uncharacterized protein (TIGR01777 family)
MNTVLITGGSGLIGRKLAGILAKDGFRVRLLSRRKQLIEPYHDVFTWNLKEGKLEPGALDGVDVVIHLAGEGIADGRWTEKRKSTILSSRIDGLNLIRREAEKQNINLKLLLSGSATGWYGAITDDMLHTEEEPSAEDFLGKTCRLWEEAADAYSSIAERVVKIRTGVVLSSKSGALPQLMLPFKFYTGVVLGSGKQQIPWIHEDDICGIFIHALKHDNMKGPFNAAATENCSNRMFTETLGRVLNRPVLPIPAPSFAIRLAFGEMSAVVLEGCRVSNAKIKNAGYVFKYNDLKTALVNLLT